MNINLKSTLWIEANEKMRKCHLSTAMPDMATEVDWVNAFKAMIAAIEDERKSNPSFAAELADLTEETGNDYGFEDILEEYFDHLEEKEEWEEVISSCDSMISLFKWERNLPSEYMFRKGNALEKAKRYDEAEKFGKDWLDKYPHDLYGVASNVFLLIELKKYKEAEELTETYLREDLICDDTNDTFFMAANRLFELTDNAYAKARVMEKINEYQKMTQ